MVDKSYHHNILALNQRNPIVHNLLWSYRPSINNKRKDASEMDLDADNQEFGEPDEVVWRDTYSLVCNMTNLCSLEKVTKGGCSNRPIKVNELERVSIALFMSYGTKKPIHSDYVYKPKHMVYSELCMVVRNLIFDANFNANNCSLTSFVSLFLASNEILPSITSK